MDTTTLFYLNQILPTLPDTNKQVVMAAGGSVKYFVDAVFNYPTLAEAYNVAAQNGLRNMGINV